MEFVRWEITYNLNNKERKETVYSKRVAIETYLECLRNKYIDSLKIFRNDKEYTETLNKFLYE